MDINTERMTPTKRSTIAGIRLAIIIFRKKYGLSPNYLILNYDAMARLQHEQNLTGINPPLKIYGLKLHIFPVKKHITVLLK